VKKLASQGEWGRRRRQAEMRDMENRHRRVLGPNFGVNRPGISAQRGMAGAIEVLMPQLAPE
jgi:hypothetical protein